MNPVREKSEVAIIYPEPVSWAYILKTSSEKSENVIIYPEPVSWLNCKIIPVREKSEIVMIYPEPVSLGKL